MLLMKHKLLSFKGPKTLDSKQKNGLFEPLIKEYCQQFRQVASLTFDLGPFLFYLSDYNAPSDGYQRSSLLEAFIEDGANQSEPLRKLRVRLNQLKLEMLLGVATHKCSQEQLVTALQNEYFDALLLDGKPEKGERKAADDYVLMINELLEQSDSSLTPNVLYRMALLESALEVSPYNFDIQLALTLLYDKTGLSVSF